MPERVLVLGNGGFGTAMAFVLNEAGHDVRVWGNNAEYTRQIQKERENPKFLPGIHVPDEIRYSPDITELIDGVETIISSVPTQFIRSTIARLATSIPAEALVITCSKGFERETGELPSTMIRSELPKAKVSVLSGPSHAEEIARGLVTTVVVAAETEDVAQRTQQLFRTGAFRAYTSTDPLGVEIAGATKNVIALAAGISDGLGFGDNARAGLVCRGASEMTRLGVRLGAQAATFSGLSGIGDLVATCTSEHSRNRSVGFQLGQGKTLQDILGATEKVAEGVETTRSLHKLAERLDVELPITREVHEVLFAGKSPRSAVADLMRRELKPES